MCDCQPIRKIVRVVLVAPVLMALAVVASVLMIPVLDVLASSALAQDSAPAAGDGGMEIEALQYEVRDLEQAVDFYTAALGFEVERREASGEEVRMRLGPMRLILAQSAAPPAKAGSARIYLNMSVADLETARAAVVDAGGHVRSEDALQSAVGSYLEVTDPSGNQIHLIDHPWDNEQQPPITPTVYNIGLAVRSIEAVERFLSELGFIVATRDYLPETLVFERRGVAYLVVHAEAVAEAEPRSATGALVLAVAEPEALLDRLRAAGRSAQRAEGESRQRVEGDAGAPGGRSMLVRGPAGNAFLLSGGGSADADRGLAVDAFARLKELKGEWRARSTKGWDETILFDVVARGSVVVETTRFKDAPDRTMHTMYHMDGDRLMLTHYCEAMNQPRLLATDIEAGGRRVVFTFLDGANIATRSVGHMDKAIYKFIDQGHFTSQWTWYEAGKESWMEAIVFERIR